MTWLLIAALIIVTPVSMVVGALIERRIERRRWEWLSRQVQQSAAEWERWSREAQQWNHEVTQALSILDPRKDTR